MVHLFDSLKPRLKTVTYSNQQSFKTPKFRTLFVKCYFSKAYGIARVSNWPNRQDKFIINSESLNANWLLHFHTLPISALKCSRRMVQFCSDFGDVICLCQILLAFSNQKLISIASHISCN